MSHEVGVDPVDDASATSATWNDMALKGSEVRLRRRFEPPLGPSQRRAEQMEPFPSKPLHVS